MKKLLLAMPILLVALPALSNPPTPKSNPLVPKSKRQNIQYADEDAVRVADVPIVRSSKGCIAYLTENKQGFVKIRYPKDKDGKRVCQSKLAYDAAPDTADQNPNPF